MKKLKAMIIVALTLSIILSLTGCNKSVFLDGYNSTLQLLGKLALTDDKDLQGERINGEDTYTGRYTADYTDFSDTEIVFGGTSLERKSEETVTINCSLSIGRGKAAIFICSGFGEQAVLLETDGEYSGEFWVEGASVYVGISGNSFSGSIIINCE